jgi:hypothetical protein
MPWYKAGTVSVTLNSNAVIGAGTAFIANSRVGDAFRGPDGRWYEVTNIASDTAMSISPVYQGATASGGSYALAPMQGYVKESADALRALVNQFGAKIAALGTTGNYDVLPLEKGGTGASVGSPADLRSTLGVMPVGGGNYAPNFQSLWLFSPPNPSAQGLHIGWNEPVGTGLSGHGSFTVNRGTGNGGFSWRSVNQANNQGGPIMTYSYDGVLDVPNRLTLSGTDVVARGSNVNGTFTKFADGSLICECVSTTIVSANAANGASFVGSAQTMVFPHAFAEPPVVVPVLTRSASTQGPAWAYLAAGDRSAIQASINIAATVQNATGYCGYIAKGRWK